MNAYHKLRHANSFQRQEMLEEAEEDNLPEEKIECDKCAKMIEEDKITLKRVNNFTWRLCEDCL
jgi:hypothetical protein